MLSDRSVAALQLAAHGAVQENLWTTPFDELSAAIRAVIDTVIAAAGEARNAQQWENRMPPEILNAIFINLDFADNVIASHVCRFWRAVALSSPVLWADIHVLADDALANLLLQTLLERTGAVPINYTLKAKPHHRSSSRRLVRTHYTSPIHLAPLTLDILGDFDIPEQPWPKLPSLKRLTMRKTSSYPLDIAAVSSFVLPVCLVLETITLVSISGFALSSSPSPDCPPCSASSLVLRGSPCNTSLTYGDLISTLRCEGVPHIALQRNRWAVGLPPVSSWTASSFEAVELYLYRPPPIAFGYDDEPVARFEDINGRSRTCMLSQRPCAFLADPRAASITRLTLDECDLNPDEFPQTSALLPSLASLTIRLVEGSYYSHRLFVPVDAEGGLLRLTQRCQGEWCCASLQNLELAYAQSSRSARVTCGELAYLLDRLCAPAAVHLRLQNLAIHDSPSSPEHELLRRRVSQLTLDPVYRPHAAERDWELWGIADDRNLPLDEFRARLEAFFRACRNPRDLRGCTSCLYFIDSAARRCDEAADIAKGHPDAPFSAALVLLEELTRVSIPRTRHALQTAQMRCRQSHGDYEKDRNDIFERFVEGVARFVRGGFYFGSQRVSTSALTRKREHFPATLNQLFPLGADRIIDALVYWCCAAPGSSPFDIVFLYLYVARNAVLPRLLVVENRERLVWSMVHALSRTAVNWPGGTPPFEYPQGFHPQEDARRGKEAIECIARVVDEIATKGNDGTPSLSNLVSGFEREFLTALETLESFLSRVAPIFADRLRSLAAFLSARLGRGAADPPSTELLVYRFASRTNVAGQGACAHTACRAPQLSAHGTRKLFYCNRCRLVRYCGADCQRADWSGAAVPHKLVCVSLAKLRGYAPQEGMTWEGFRAAWEQAALDPADEQNLRRWVLATGVVPPDAL
ncbi:hypothetical protein AURDEDRAFT_128150 [Auricularia subglabra TFB-10046 SS5]|nr:hypothetical protein AURDEDRAFT_128150 [Auricularia subglabra TFB-10046 SS5]